MEQSKFCEEELAAPCTEILQSPPISPPNSPSNPSQQVSAPASSSFPSSGSSVGAGNSTSGNSQIPWPKMKPSDVQKYTKVFMEVDTDRDGRITGEQARNLFLSWRLPREVLKQLWDLSDQDNDSMLSLREFCFSLYLMERYREGRPLPDTLPHNVMHDETLLSMTGQPKVAYGNAAWSLNPGFGQHQGMQGVAPAAGLRPPMQRSLPQADGALQPNQQNLRVRGMEGLNTTQHDNGKQDSANSKPEEDAGKKGEPAAPCTESGEKMKGIDLDDEPADAEHFHTALATRNSSDMRSLRKGDTFTLGSLTFKVTETFGERCVVSPEIFSQGEPVRREDDVDGVWKQMAQICEVIELPVSYSELFTSVGVKAPKGIMLPGPPGSGRALIVRDHGGTNELFQNALGTSNLTDLHKAIMYTYGMVSPLIRELGGESGGESSISARYNEIRSDDGIDERAGDDEISSEDDNNEQRADEEDVPKPPTASTRSAWGRVARWGIGVSIPLIAGSATIVSTRSRGITFDVFAFFTNGLSFLMLLIATIILRTPFPTLTPSLFIRIMGLHVFEPLSQIWLSFGAQFLPAQFTVCLQSVVPALTYFISLIFRIQSISIHKKSDQAKLGGLAITFFGAFLIGKYNGPTIAAHRLVNENWTWPLCLVIASVLCSACHNVLMEEPYACAEGGAFCMNCSPPP